MADIEDIQVSLPCENSGEEPERNATEAEEEHGRGETEKTFMKGLQSRCLSCENSGEEPERNATEAEEEHGRGETEKTFMKGLQSRWQAILIGILLGLICGLTGALTYLICTQQSLTAELQHMAEKIFTVRNNTKQFQIEISQLKQLLNSNENFTLLGSDYGQLELFINAALHNSTLLSTENTQLSLRLKNTLQEKTQLGLLLKNASQEKKHLSLLLKNTSQDVAQLSLLLKNISQEKKHLNLLLNNTLQEKMQLSLLLKNTSQEKKRLNLLLNNTLQEKTQLGLLLKNTSQEKKHLNLLLNNTLQEKTQLSLLLKNTSQEKKHLSLLLKNTSQEKTQLSLLLKNMLQEKTQLEVENKDLNMFLNSTLENCNVVQGENRQLNLLLNESLHILSMTSTESKQLHRQLYNEQQTSMQLEAENQHQRSILFSNKLSFLWRFCNKSTLQCSRCLPGWTEHNSRCFFLSQETEKWEDARRQCLDLGADLAVVSNAEDQAFLTNMTFQFIQRHPQENFHSAWIGLRDMVREGTFIWINGNKIQSDVTYWMHLEPNNAMASWDKDQAGQDCVAIVPPKQIVQEDWLNSWDDIVCVGKRHYLCETMALSLS